MTTGLVTAAQIVSGFAALAAVWLAIVTIRASRRVPLTDSYMSAWESILDVLAVAGEITPERMPEEEADLLMRKYTVADHRLSVIESTLGVRVYGRDIRHDVKNLLIDTLYGLPWDVDPQQPDPVMADIMERPDWADCTDEEWLRVVNSVPYSAMFNSQVTERPGRHADVNDALLRWYYPVVRSSLDRRDSVTSSTAPPHQQLSFMLRSYVDSFLLPWIRDASREALLGRISWPSRRRLWAQRLRAWWRRWRHPRRRRPVGRASTPYLFSPTDPSGDGL